MVVLILKALKGYSEWAPVAQLVEQTTYTRPVLGSSPSGRTNKKEPQMALFY